jgi:hypothetical protein
MLFEHHQQANISLEDVEEVSNYVKAITYGILRLKDNFPLSLRLYAKSIMMTALTARRALESMVKLVF